MADTIYTSQTPVVQNDFDGDSHAWGPKFTVSADCNLTGGRAWVPTAGRPTTFKWQVWRVGDSTKIAESDLNGAGHGSPSSGAWMSFTSALFATPGNVSLSSAQTYRVCVAFQGGDGVYTDNGTESFPVGSGGLVSASTGSFTNSGGTNVMPGTDYVAYFFADVNVEASSDARAAVGTATGIAGSTAGAAKVGKASTTVGAIGSATSTARKVGVAAGTVPAVGVSSAQASKAAVVAAAAAAFGAAALQAAKVAKASANAAGLAGATGQAKKVVAVSGRCLGVALARRSAVDTPGTLTPSTVGAALTATAPRSAITASTSTPDLSATARP